MSTLADQPAFPRSGTIHNKGYGEQSGLTLRQHFAGLAMQGLLANPNYIGATSAALQKQFGDNWISVFAAAQADALLAALEKPRP